MDMTRSNQDDFLLSLEGHLLTSLHPVAPDPRFITTLKRRLVSNDPPILERETSILSLLLIALGLLSGVAILLLGKKAILVIIAGIGVIVNQRRKPR